MLRSRGVRSGVLLGLAAGVVLTACSGGSGNGGTTSPLPTQSTPPSSTSSSPSVTGTPAVPLDEIPPGKTTWVPTGVSTTAPFKAATDKTPLFNVAMYKHDQDGAVAAAIYYQQAENWIAAANSSVAMRVICDDATCLDSAAYVDKIAAKGQHIVGQRVTYSDLSFRKANPGAKGEVVVEFTAQYAAGLLVNSNGKAAGQFKAMTQHVRLYMKWNGHRWLVGGEYLAS